MKRNAPDDAAILQAMRALPDRPVHVAEVLTALGLTLSSRRSVSDALDALVERGLVQAMPGARYRVAKARGTRVEGRFTQHPRGFAFVSASDGGGDVFIPAGSILGAMHGDLVAAMAVEGTRGREGLVTEVLTRRSDKVPGTLRRRGRGTWVEPDDERIRGPIVVEETDLAHDGEVVLCVVTRWPEHPGEAPQGRVAEVLGEPGELGVEVRKVLLREGVDEGFPDDANEEAAALPDTVLPAEIEGRDDLRGLDLVTVDPDDARDHDDAIHVANREGGGWTVTVAIADVSHYVRPGTALDRATAMRGTSIYLPDRAIPMLPHALSSHLASLREGVDRLSVGVVVELDDDGEVVSKRLFEAVINSRARLTYSRVARALGWTTEGPAVELPDALGAMLTVAGQCAERLRARRMRRGALDFDLPEGRVRFAEDKVTPIDVVQSRQDPGVRKAYGLIEELMILANEVVAQTCVEEDVPTIFRIHGEPDAGLLERFLTAARMFGHPLSLEDARKPRKLSAFLRRVQSDPSAKILNALLLRAMPQARYAAVNKGHFGLASEAYLHFTSPIRRAPDIIAHRAVRAMIRKERVARDEAARNANGRLAAEVSRLERRAMDVEREVLDLYRCVVARGHLGEIVTGTVSNVGNAGVWVDIPQPFLSGLLRVESLGGDTWEIDELGLRMVGTRTGRTFTLGESITVEIADVSMARRAVYVELPVEEREAMANAARSKKPRKDKSKSSKPERKKGARRR